MLSSPRRPTPRSGSSPQPNTAGASCGEYPEQLFPPGPFLLMDFCLIFVPFGHYDEPEILSYAITSICPKGADVRQLQEYETKDDMFVFARVN